MMSFIQLIHFIQTTQIIQPIHFMQLYFTCNSHTTTPISSYTSYFVYTTHTLHTTHTFHTAHTIHTTHTQLTRKLIQLKKRLTGTTDILFFHRDTPRLSLPPSVVSDDTTEPTDFADAAAEEAEVESLALEATGTVPRFCACCTATERAKEGGELAHWGLLEGVTLVLTLGMAIALSLALAGVAAPAAVPRGTCPHTCCTTLRTSSIFMGLRRTTSAPSCMHTTSSNGIHVLDRGTSAGRRGRRKRKKQEIVKQDTLKQEATKQETLRQEAMRQEAMKQETLKQETYDAYTCRSSRWSNG